VCRTWKEIASYIGDFQARLLLTVFYFTIVTPFALLVRLFSDPLRVRHPETYSGWTKRGGRETNLEAARRQF
jgi:hypothetical protein